MRATELEVDINKFNKNIESIQKYIGNKKIMPVIKANGYGTYINKRLDIINKFDINIIKKIVYTMLDLQRKMS